MRRFFYDSFQEYARESGVKKVDFILKTNDTLNKRLLEERVIQQLQHISEFHKVSCGFNGYLKRRINNDTCKLVEEYKVQLKRLNKHVEKIIEEGPIDSVELYLLNEGESIIKRAQKCIESIEENNYIDLISRSMKKVEICLTDVDFDNLVRLQTLEVANFDDVAYNMVEMDAFYLLSKLKRKGASINYKKCVERFCAFEDLKEDSRNFILALLSYPHEFMRVYEKYRRNKKSWTDEEYIKRFDIAMKEDGCSLISEVEKC